MSAPAPAKKSKGKKKKAKPSAKSAVGSDVKPVDQQVAVKEEPKPEPKEPKGKGEKSDLKKKQEKSPPEDQQQPQPVAKAPEQPVEGSPPEPGAVKVPNVKPKMDPKEKKRMESMIGSIKQQASIFITDEDNQVKVFEDEGTVDLKDVPTVYLKKCKNGEYKFDRRTTKILIEDCENCRITINRNVLTNTIEIWKCKNVTLDLNGEVRTLQLDMLRECNFNFAQLSYMGGIVWNQIHGSKISFGDKKELSFRTGLKEMKEKYPDTQEDTDQFIIRFLDDKILQERCIRLKNGHLSTEREAIEWDKRNEVKKQEYLDNFLQEAGIKLGKSQDGENNRDRNAPCSCGSGKKFKKCYMGKKKAGGSDIIYK